MHGMLLVMVFTLGVQSWAQMKDVTADAWKTTDLDLSLSKTFISNEIYLLESMGMPLELFSLKLAEAGQQHATVAAIQTPVTYLPETSSLTETPLRAWLGANLPQFAASHLRLCWRRLRLERRGDGPCFARQLRRCAGVCVGEEEPSVHDARLVAALAPLAIPAWPCTGPALVHERAAFGERADVHVLRDWCWLGTALDEADLAALLDAPPRPQFDIDVVRLLLRRWSKGSLALRSVPASPPAAYP